MTNYATETEAESYEAADLARIALQAAIEAVEKHQDRHGLCDAPFRCTLHVDSGNEADREVSAPDDEPNEALRRAPEDYRQSTGQDGWIRHDGGECPVHPMDVVEMYQGGESQLQNRSGVAAGNLIWRVVTSYRPLRDEDGIPYCTAEGLEDWAEYVATDNEIETAWQYDSMPRTVSYCNRWGIHSGARSASIAPEKFANTRDHWPQTLRRVWRREDA